MKCFCLPRFSCETSCDFLLLVWLIILMYGSLIPGALRPSLHLKRTEGLFLLCFFQHSYLAKWIPKATFCSNFYRQRWVNIIQSSNRKHTLRSGNVYLLYVSSSVIITSCERLLSPETSPSLPPPLSTKEQTKRKNPCLSPPNDWKAGWASDLAWTIWRKSLFPYRYSSSISSIR